MTLRARMAAAAALVTFTLTTAAALLVVTAQWSAERSSVSEQAELLSIDQADAATFGRLEIELGPVGVDEFALALIGEDVVAATGDVIDEVEGFAIGNAIENGVDQGTVAVEQVDVDGQRWATAATSCLDLEVCDTVAVAVRAPTWPEALAERLIIVILSVLGATALAAGAAAWLAARALRPVEAMRAELAATTASDLTRRVPVVATGDELERLAVTMNQTLDRLEAAVVANRRFTADAAHELRSPLAGIRAAVELRASEADDDLLDETLDTVDRANALVEQLLVLARGQEARDTSDPVSLASEVDQQVHRGSRSRPSLHLAVERTPPHADVAIPSTSAQRIVGNLIGNAVRHARTAVRVDLTSDEGWIHLSVSDDGEGIPEADRTRVLERFVRLDESRARSSGGTGLGLAIVAETASALGGTTRVVESVGGGARVVVTLPAQPTR